MNSCPTCGKELLPGETCTIPTIEVKTEKITLESLKLLLKKWSYRGLASTDSIGTSWLPNRSRSSGDYIFWNYKTVGHDSIVLEFDSNIKMVKVWREIRTNGSNLWFITDNSIILKDRLKDKI